MDAITDSEVQPIVAHLREAAEHVRLANHAANHDRRSAPELYDTVGALHELVSGLPQLIKRLDNLVTNTNPQQCYHAHDGDVTDTLDHAASLLTDARISTGAVISDVACVFNKLGYLGITTTDE